MNLPGRSVVLIGFMGAGKSAVGRELAHQTKLTRHDTDEIIRMRFGISIPEIFAQQGENIFRDAETDALRDLKGRSGLILVTGGGIVLRDENVRLLRSMGMTIWLDAPEEILWRRASRRQNRPLLQTLNPRAQFTSLLRARLPLYQSAADHRIDTSDATVPEVAGQIAKLL